MYKSRDSIIIPQSWQSSQFPPDFASQIQSGMLWSKPTTVETLWLGSTGSLRTLDRARSLVIDTRTDFDYRSASVDCTMA